MTEELIAKGIDYWHKMHRPDLDTLKFMGRVSELEQEGGLVDVIEESCKPRPSGMAYSVFLHSQTIDAVKESILSTLEEKGFGSPTSVEKNEESDTLEFEYYIHGDTYSLTFLSSEKIE